MFPKQLISKRVLQPCWSLHLHSYSLRDERKSLTHKPSEKGNAHASYGNRVCGSVYVYCTFRLLVSFPRLLINHCPGSILHFGSSCNWTATRAERSFGITHSFVSTYNENYDVPKSLNCNDLETSRSRYLNSSFLYLGSVIRIRSEACTHANAVDNATASKGSS